MIFSIEEQVLVLGEGKDTVQLEFRVDRRDTARQLIIATWPSGEVDLWTFAKNAGLLEHRELEAPKARDVKDGAPAPLDAALAEPLPSDMPRPPKTQAEIDQLSEDVNAPPSAKDAKAAAKDAEDKQPKETVAADGTKVSPVHGKINTVRGDLGKQA